jgi:HTH-type transcriptional regulator/antitoxin HipB
VESPRDLGLVVRGRRKELGWSQEHLAARADVSRWWISTLESGKPRAELALVLRTLAALELSIDVSPQRAPAGVARPAAPTYTVDLDELLRGHIHPETRP